MADYLTFNDIKALVKRAVKTPKGSKDTLIGEFINMVYMNEIIPVDDLYPLFWLVDFNDKLASKAVATITGASAADPCVITAVAHGFVAGDLVGIYNVVGMTELNNRQYRVNTAPTADTLTLIDLDTADAIDSSAYTAYTSGGTLHHRGLTLATNIQRILRAKWHGYGEMDPITPAEIEESTTAMSDSTSRPSRYLHRKSFLAVGTEIDQILWFQAADAAYDLRFWFEKHISPLSGTNVPMIPPVFHNMIAAGAIMRLSQDGVQVETPLLWPQIYTSQIASLKIYNRKFYKESGLMHE